MRELLSWFMLMTDEAWLNHAARIRSEIAVTPQDVKTEDMLFACERLFKHMHAQLDVAARDASQSARLAPAHAGHNGRSANPR